eukprot:GHVU01025312.1.p1 GENE.GHVU01025312.1~~GHVU01025312.1.p1  ORF type:complete len:179 (-),score=6.76 GHVU01025312.1:291-827(-)
MNIFEAASSKPGKGPPLGPRKRTYSLFRKSNDLGEELESYVQNLESRRKRQVVKKDVCESSSIELLILASHVGQMVKIYCRNGTEIVGRVCEPADWIGSAAVTLRDCCIIRTARRPRRIGPSGGAPSGGTRLIYAEQACVLLSAIRNYEFDSQHVVDRTLRFARRRGVEVSRKRAVPN